MHIRLAGQRRPADVQVVADQAGVVGSMARDNHQFAKFNNIGLDQHGKLHLAWATGARVALLTPQ